MAVVTEKYFKYKMGQLEGICPVLTSTTSKIPKVPYQLHIYKEYVKTLRTPASVAGFGVTWRLLR